MALSFTTTTSDAPQAVGPAYKIVPSISFAKPALLALAYGRGDTQASSAAALSIAANAGTGWFVVGGGSVDPIRHALTVPVAATSPAPPASVAPGAVGASQSLAATDAIWAVILSWELFPTGRAAVLTGGMLDLTLRYIGTYSSSGGGVSMYVTPPEPPQLSWRLETAGGNPGVVLTTGATTGRYVAPACPPSSVVLIEAIGKFKNGPSSVQIGNIPVRVLARNWTVTVTWITDWQCVGSELVSDHATYTESLDFSLNDKLDLAGAGVPGQVSHEYGTEKACSSCGCIKATRSTDTIFSVNLPQGGFYPDDDQFELYFGGSFPLKPSYVLELVDGTSETTKTAALPVAALVEYLTEGPNTDPTFDGVGTDKQTLKFNLTSKCP